MALCGVPILPTELEYALEYRGVDAARTSPSQQLIRFISPVMRAGITSAHIRDARRMICSVALGLPERQTVAISIQGPIQWRLSSEIDDRPVQRELCVPDAGRTQKRIVPRALHVATGEFGR